MAFRKVSLFTLLFLLCFCVTALGQGISSFKTVQNNGVDVIDLSTLSVLMSTDVRSKPNGFSVIQPINGYVQTGLPNTAFQEAHLGTIINNRVTIQTCGALHTVVYQGFTYTEPSGTVHAFPNAKTDSLNCLGSTLTDHTSDGSGLTIVLTAGKNWQYATVYDSRGGAHRNPSTGNITYTDSNGNVRSQTPGTNGAVFTDQYNTTVLSQQISGTDYTYTDAAGNTRTISKTTSTVTFGNACGTLPVSNGTIVNSVSYPDGTSMRFGYETWLAGGTTYYTGRLTSVQLRTGGTITYSYSGGTAGINCADLTTATLTRVMPDGSTWTYVHTPPSGSHVSTTVVTDPAGNYTNYSFTDGYETQRLSYTANGTLLHTVQTCYNNIACANQTAVLEPISEVDTYTTPAGVGTAVVKLTYDANTGLLTQVRHYDFGSSNATSTTSTTYGSYSNGSCVGISAYIYEPCTVITTDHNGTTVQSSRFTYDSLGNSLSASQWVSGSNWLTSLATYNANGTVATTTDVNGAQVTYSNFACNGFLPQDVLSPLGLTSHATYDCNGGVQVSGTDANSNISYTNYAVNGAADPFWRPLNQVDALNNVTTLSYPSVFLTGAVMNFGGSQSATWTTVDNLGRASVQQTPQVPNSTTSMDTVSRGYDSNGRVSTVAGPCTRNLSNGCTTPSTTTTYDALSRPLTVTNGTGYISYAYNKQDILMTAGPAPSGERTKQRQYEYDGLGRLVSVCEITNASGSVSCGQANTIGLNFTTGYKTTYAYDDLGRMIGVTQGSQTRTFAYDGLGRMTSETNPESGTTTYTYDNVVSGNCSMNRPGDLVMKLDASGNGTCYGHDQLHRLNSIGQSYNGSPNASVTPDRCFTYDSAVVNGITLTNTRGRLAEAYTVAQNAGCNAAKITDEGFSYSVRGELTDMWESTPHSGGYYHTSASYYPNGVVKSLSGIGSQATVSYGVDSEGRPYSATQNNTTYVSDVIYNNASQPLTIAYGNGDSDAYTYNNAGQVTTYQFNVGSASMTGTLTWNTNGSLSQLAITDGFNSNGTHICNFSADDLARLTTDNCGSTWSQTFIYDAFGNITKSGSSAWAPGYDPTTNHYLSPATYDAAGNPTYDLIHHYTWNSYGKPATIDSTITPTYDALNRLVENNNNGTILEYEYSPVGKMTAMNGQSQYQGAYLPLPGGAILYQSASTGIYHKDWLGSVRLSSSYSARSIFWDTAYAPFGEGYKTVTGSPHADFTGDRQDTVAGEYDTPNRLQHPGQSRWISPDPAGIGAVSFGNPQSWNRYTYALNNPLTLVDPTGMNSAVCDLGGADTDPDCTSNDGTNLPDAPSAVGGNNGPPATWGWGTASPDNSTASLPCGSYCQIASDLSFDGTTGQIQTGGSHTEPPDPAIDVRDWFTGMLNDMRMDAMNLGHMAHGRGLLYSNRTKGDAVIFGVTSVVSVVPIGRVASALNIGSKVTLAVDESTILRDTLSNPLVSGPTSEMDQDVSMLTKEWYDRMGGNPQPPWSLWQNTYRVDDFGGDYNWSAVNRFLAGHDPEWMIKLQEGTQ